MVDLSKEIIFRDGITLDNGVGDLDDSLLAAVENIRELGISYGLSLDKFEINDELIYFEWRGTKRDMLRFYTHYSERMTTESLDKRKEAQKIILGK